jgi:glutathione S-transferase
VVHLLQVEHWIPSSGEFLAGQQLTHVDLVLFTTLSALRSGWVPGAAEMPELQWQLLLS